jgi:hypothetical protein
LAFALSLADYIRQALTQFVLISLVVIMLDAIFLIIWFIVIGLRLMQMANANQPTIYAPKD